MFRCVRVLVVVAVILASSLALWAQGDEPPPALKASALLDATQMKGPHHTIAEAVQTPGLLPCVHHHLALRDVRGQRH